MKRIKIGSLLDGESISFCIQCLVDAHGGIVMLKNLIFCLEWLTKLVVAGLTNQASKFHCNTHAD